MGKSALAHKISSQSGFSLTEVLIAVLVFLFCLVALAKFMGGLFAMDSYANQRTEALQFAQEKLADLESFGVIPVTSGYSAYASIATGSDTVTGTTATYTRTWTVTSNTTIGYDTVLIQVTWTAQDGSSKTLELTSIIGEIDPSIVAQSSSVGSSGQITP